jgi:hypothetical protein
LAEISRPVITCKGLSQSLFTINRMSIAQP